jgi:hypothetical protein
MPQRPIPERRIRSLPSKCMGCAIRLNPVLSLLRSYLDARATPGFCRTFIEIPMGTVIQSNSCGHGTGLAAGAFGSQFLLLVRGCVCETRSADHEILAAMRPQQTGSEFDEATAAAFGIPGCGANPLFCAPVNSSALLPNHHSGGGSAPSGTIRVCALANQMCDR